MGDFFVEPDKLKQDGKKWLEWNNELTEISDAVPMIGPELTILDFSFLLGAQQVQQAYAAVTEMFKTGLNEGAEQFRGVSDKLEKVADIYVEVEQSLVDSISVADHD